MSIRIITDSASDLTFEEASRLNIEVVPLTVSFGETSYRDGLDLSHEGFFEKLIESDVLPVTSQVTPFAFKEAFDKATADGSSVICIVVSSKLSGCYQSACIAAEECRGDVRVIDSLNACIGQSILAQRAAMCRDEGMNVDDIVNTLEKEKGDIRVIALLDTLEYLKKGGRISSAVAFAGALLSIKPVIAVEDGEVKLLGKARGSRNGSNMLMKLTRENSIDFNRPLELAYSGLTDVMLRKYIEDSKELYDCEPDDLPRCSIGCVIGTHVGPGAIAAAFFAKEVG